MYDQNSPQGQTAQPQDNNPYGQLPPNNSGMPSTDLSQPQTPAPSFATPSTAQVDPADQTKPVVNDDLLTIKQDALQQLNPLVEHLEQNPEEKFKTTMMMIQASDDQALIKSAYETAKQITDEKARAQALLDIVNEINYFTQQNNNN